MAAHTKLSYGPLAASMFVLFALLTMPMEAGAQINGSCCGEWVTIKKNGAGFDKKWSCESGMRNGTPEFQTGICEELQAKGKMCPEIAPYCVFGDCALRHGSDINSSLLRHNWSKPACDGVGGNWAPNQASGQPPLTPPTPPQRHWWCLWLCYS